MELMFNIGPKVLCLAIAVELFIQKYRNLFCHVILQEECEYWTLLYKRYIGQWWMLFYVVRRDGVDFQLNRVFEIAVRMH